MKMKEFYRFIISYCALCRETPEDWNGSVIVSRRDVPGKQGKVFGISMEASVLVAYVKDKLDEIQSLLLDRAISFREMCILNPVNVLYCKLIFCMYSKYTCMRRALQMVQCTNRLMLLIIFRMQMLVSLPLQY